MKKMTIRNTVLLGLLLCLGLSSKAQFPMSLYFLENVPQSNFMNPAMTPRANGFVGIPFASGIYFSVASDISTKDIFQKNGSNYVTPLNYGFDYNKLYKKIGKAVNIDLNQTYAPLLFGFRGKRGYITIGVIDKVEENLALPKAFLQIPENGGIPNGSNFDLSTMNLNLTFHREFSLGYTYRFSQRLKVGVHAKMLFGLASITTDVKQFEFNTSKEEWNYNLDATIYGSFPVNEIYTSNDGNGNVVVDSIDMPDVDLPTVIENMVTNFDNPGFGIDVGAVYELGKIWQFSAALNNIGYIKWNGNLNSFHSKGQFSFEGLDLSIDDLQKEDGDTTNIITGIVDSIKNSIQFTHGNEAFKTTTTPRLYLGAKYNINHIFSVGVLSRSLFYENNFRQEFNVSTNFNLYHFITASLSYNIAVKGTNSVGLALGTRLGPLQFYFIGDYLPTNYRNYVIESEDGTQTPIPGPESLQNLSFMFGLNLLFGANGFTDEPMIDAYTEY